MKKFILGYVLEKDCLVEFKTEKEASELAEDWVNVYANNLKEAKTNVLNHYQKLLILLHYL